LFKFAGGYRQLNAGELAQNRIHSPLSFRAGSPRRVSAMLVQGAGGNGGEVVWFAQDLLQVSTGEALRS
jgi:hypothetical protein